MIMRGKPSIEVKISIYHRKKKGGSTEEVRCGEG